MYSGRLKEIEGLGELFKAILSLRDADECYRFFDDLCTVGELKAMGQRYAVATALINHAKYEEIERSTGASSATISRVKRFVDYGAGGYRLVHQRIEEAEGGDGER